VITYQDDDYISQNTSPRWSQRSHSRGKAAELRSQISWISTTTSITYQEHLSGLNTDQRICNLVKSKNIPTCLFIPHSSLHTPHSTLLIPHSSLLTLHSSLFTTQRCIPHYSPLTYAFLTTDLVIHSPPSLHYSSHITLFTTHRSPSFLHHTHLPKSNKEKQHADSTIIKPGGQAKVFASAVTTPHPKLETAAKLHQQGRGR